MLRPSSQTFVIRAVVFGLAALGLGDNAQAFTLISFDHPVITVSEGDPTPANGPSETSNQPRNSISQNGCRLAITSRATNLAPLQNDGNGDLDVFLFDRCSSPPTVTLVSHQGGRPNDTATGRSDQPVITPDGLYVVFRSTAGNIVSGAGFVGGTNIFLWEVDTDSFTLISDGIAGGMDSGDGDSQNAVISRTTSGRPVVAFESVARNLVAGDANGLSDVFRNASGVIELVSIRNLGLPGLRRANGGSFRPDINGPGTCIVYESLATNLVADPTIDTNTVKDVFRWSTGNPANILLSHLPGAGNETIPGDGESSEPSIDDVCERFAFKSAAKNLVALQDEGNSETDVFHAGNGGDVVLVSHRDGTPNRTGSGGASYAPIISRDGKWVAYASYAVDLAPGQVDPGVNSDVFLFDISDKNVLVSHLAGDDKAAAGGSSSPEISRDGRYVAYESDSKELDPNQNDGNGGLDVFLYNRTWNNSVLVSRRYASIAIAGGAKSYRPVLSAGDATGALGYWVAFTSEADDLIADDPDTSGQPDVFYFLTPLQIPFLTARSTTNSNTIEWVTSSVNYVSMRTFYTIGSCPANFSGVIPGNELLTGSPRGNTRAQFTHGSLIANTSYCYAIFAQRDHQGAIGASDPPWRTTVGQTLPAASTAVRWSINLANMTALTQVGIGTQGHVAVANDGGVYGFTRGPGGGFWAGTSWPFRVFQPIQGRPPIVPFSTLGSARTTYVASQSGRAFAFDADRLALAGGALWYTSPKLGDVVLPGASGMFTLFGGVANHILIGSRTGSQGSFHVLDAATGAPRGSVTGPAQGAIFTAASVDYVQRRVYFASQEAIVGSSPSLWCLNLNAAGFSGPCWGAPISNPSSISGGPVQRAGKLYVGDDDGTTWAFDATLGSLAWSSAGCSLGNPIRSFVLADRGGSQDLYYSAGNSVCALTDLGASASVKWGISSIPNPTAPVLARLGGVPYIFVGSGPTGRLYQINADDPFAVGGIKNVLLRPGATIGAPAFDIGDGMIYVGSDAGVIFAVQVPLP